MGYGIKLTVLATLSAIGFGALKVSNLFEIPPVPTLDETWWGPGTPSAGDKSIRPFKIAVEDEVLKDLQYRLKHTRDLPPPLEGAQQNYGMNSKLTKKIVDFWLNDYKWKEREQFLNKFPQFKTNIQGLDIHFLHVKPKETKGLKVLPLLLIHGWPGSVREFYEIIPLLTTPQNGRNFVYEVIVPSLPGYGFSSAAVRPGLGAPQMTVVMKNLMKRLNFEKFYVQGGDWGAIISTYLATLFPHNVIAMHSNMCSAMSAKSALKMMVYSFKPSSIIEEKYEHLIYPMSNFYSRLIEETGYLHIQASKPDTVGTALTDSPAGLAAYILEKFTTWTNPQWKQLEDGGLLKKYKMEDLLDNVMIYWVTSSITTSMRLYAESMNKEQLAMRLDIIPVNVPSGCSRFIHDIVYSPTALLEDKYPNLIHVTDHDGGHFAAFELPAVLAKDIYDFTDKVLRLKTEK
ncbi:hypothetical protein HHI36_003074 [Cryptolaemus montrouzieri]|uniref:Epoxide hydrolase n=1 Tax=Cryptolaemus montrouzieri TaxID=559131 RepID=A0ABD2PCW6_9CUCU